MDAEVFRILMSRSSKDVHRGKNGGMQVFGLDGILYGNQRTFVSGLTVNKALFYATGEMTVQAVVLHLWE